MDHSTPLTTLHDLYLPVGLAGYLCAADASDDEEARRRLFHLAKSQLELFRNRTSRFESPRYRLTSLGYEAFDRFYLSFAALLQAEWGTAAYQDLAVSVQESIAALAQARELGPFTIERD